MDKHTKADIVIGWNTDQEYGRIPADHQMKHTTDSGSNTLHSQIQYLHKSSFGEEVDHELRNPRG